MSAVAAVERESHVDALTGVRALAAGWVVAFHFWLNAGHPSLALRAIGIDVTPLVAVGWLGVDVFFILSGFVLTWQVLHQQSATPSFARTPTPSFPRTREPSVATQAAPSFSSTPTPSFPQTPTPSFPRTREPSVFGPSFRRDAASFLRRRILRVYPAYLACISVLLALGWWGIYRAPPGLIDLSLHLVMFHNINPRYIDSINGVFWSMPFEWQFYLIFPLLILPVLRARTRWLVASAVAVALCMKLISALHGPGAEIAQLSWRIDEFVAGMAGAAIAVRSGWSPRAYARLTWIAAAVLVLGAWIVGVRDATWWQPGAMPIIRAAWIDVGVASLLIGISGAMTPIARIFASRVMVFLGAISYSIYLWHLPTLELTRWAMRTHFPAKPVAFDYTIAIVAILVISTLSYYLIERPFHAPSREGVSRWRDPRIRASIVGAWILALFVLTASLGH